MKALQTRKYLSQQYFPYNPPQPTDALWTIYSVSIRSCLTNKAADWRERAACLAPARLRQIIATRKTPKEIAPGPARTPFGNPTANRRLWASGGQARLLRRSWAAISSGLCKCRRWRSNTPDALLRSGVARDNAALIGLLKPILCYRW